MSVRLTDFLGFHCPAFKPKSVAAEFPVTSQDILSQKRGGPAVASFTVVLMRNLSQGQGHRSGQSVCYLKGI